MGLNMSVIGFNAGLALQAALVTEKAAIAASHLSGRGDEKAACLLYTSPSPRDS